MNNHQRRRRIRKRKLMDWQRMVREEVREEMRDRDEPYAEAVASIQGE